MKFSRSQVGLIIFLTTSFGSPITTFAYESVMLTKQDQLSGLEQALRASLQLNPAINGQLSQMTAQDSAIDAAKASRYPTFGFDIDTMTEGEANGTIALEQPLWTFGKTDAAIGFASAKYQVETKGLLQVRRTLIQSTATAYTKIQSVKLKITVAVENVAEHKRLFERIQRRQKGQLASVADVRLATSRLLQAQSELLQYEGELKARINELYAITRSKVSTDTEINPSYMSLPNEQDIQSRAVSASAEIAYAKEEVNLAKAELEQTKANPFPTLSARVEQSVFDAADIPNQDETRFGVVLTGQLSGLGVSAYNQINESTERITAAQFELDSVRNEVERETTNLIVNRDLQESLRTSQQETLAALEDTMASFLRQYETNRKSWVEVLNQQRELAQMRYTVIATDQTWKEISLQIASKIGNLDAAAGMGKSL